MAAAFPVSPTDGAKYAGENGYYTGGGYYSGIIITFVG